MSRLELIGWPKLHTRLKWFIFIRKGHRMDRPDRLVVLYARRLNDDSQDNMPQRWRDLLLVDIDRREARKIFFDTKYLTSVKVKTFVVITLSHICSLAKLFILFKMSYFLCFILETHIIISETFNDIGNDICLYLCLLIVYTWEYWFRFTDTLSHYIQVRMTQHRPLDTFYSVETIGKNFFMLYGAHRKRNTATLRILIRWLLQSHTKTQNHNQSRFATSPFNSIRSQSRSLQRITYTTIEEFIEIVVACLQHKLPSKTTDGKRNPLELTSLYKTTSRTPFKPSQRWPNLPNPLSL